MWQWIGDSSPICPSAYLFQLPCLVPRTPTGRILHYFVYLIAEYQAPYNIAADDLIDSGFISVLVKLKG